MEGCFHKNLVVEGAPTDFECDLCGEKASSTYLVFRDNVLKCTECGILIHERCREKKLTPALAMYAEYRIRERKAAELWRTSLLPELRIKHAALEQKVKSMQETVKRATAKAEEALWNRSWALRSFALMFYSETNPEKCEASQLNPLVAYYAKNPARCRLFFDRLVSAYPDHKVTILVQAAEMEESLKRDEAELGELETLEASFEHMCDLRDELQRETAFPLNPAFGVSPKWRIRLSFEGITLAMGDFFMEYVRMSIKVHAGMVQMGEERVPSVQVELSGIDTSRKANIAASIVKMGLSGPMLPVNYFVSAMAVAFDFRCHLRVDYHDARGDKRRKGEWIVAQDATVCEVSNLRQSVEGASIPLPSKVLDLVLSSLLTFGVKQAILAVLPADLGEYIAKLNRPACDFEWRLKIESVLTREMRLNASIDKLACLGRLNIHKHEAEALVHALRVLNPRPGNEVVWTVARAVELHRRFIKDSPFKDKWASLWSTVLPPGVTADRLWGHLEQFDNKPCSVEIDCLSFKIALNVRALARVIRSVLLRAVSTRSTTALEMRSGLKRASSSASALPALQHTSPSPPPVMPQQQLASSSRATAEQARAAISEVCASFEEAVESALSHALRRLQFSFEFVVAGGTLSSSVKRVRMVSRLGEQFEAPIPAQWLGEKVLQSAKEGWPWKSIFQVEPTSGALKFVFARSDEVVTTAAIKKTFGDLVIQVAEIEVRIAFDGLVEELMRQQRQQLFGSSE
jgi:hypothetical protein